MKSSSGDKLRMNHILESIQILDTILEGISYEIYYSNIEKRLATERLLEIIGEAITNISDETLQKSIVKINWRQVKAFRNFVAHEYFRVDSELVYSIATTEIADLKKAVKSLLNLED